MPSHCSMFILFPIGYVLSLKRNKLLHFPLKSFLRCLIEGSLIITIYFYYSGTSFLAGFVIFAILGHMSYEQQIPIADVAESGKHQRPHLLLISQCIHFQILTVFYSHRILKTFMLSVLNSQFTVFHLSGVSCTSEAYMVPSFLS